MHNEDMFIQEQVHEALRNNEFLQSDDIRIEVHNGQVTLHGMVDVLAEKWEAGKTAGQVPGVAGVDNSLTLAIDRQPEDNEIAEAVEDKLLEDPQVDLHQITVTVKSGSVYLQGNVSNAAVEQDAKELSARVLGVKDVVSYLRIGQDSFEIDDATLTNAVETAFSRSLLVSVRDIETTTVGGKVKLTGTVDTPEQIQAASRIAAQVPGVKKVINVLDSRHGSRDRDKILTNVLRDELGSLGLGGVTAYVVDKTAFLDGAVGTAEQKEQAEEAVSHIEGIDGISNDIQIS